MMSRMPSHSFLLALLFVTGAYAVAEELTLTTYYPSPRGVYEDLRATGRVGIGTMVPPAQLTVAGGGLDPVGSTCPAGTEFYDENQNASIVPTPEPGECRRTALVARADATAARVGIGTANPQAPLQVNSAPANPATPSILIERSNSTGSPRLVMVDTALGPVTTAPGWGIDNVSDRFRIFRQPDISTGGFEVLTAINTGNVGIGTTNPGIAKTYVSNDGTNVGLYVGNGTPFGQAKLEIDGPAATHIWVQEGGAAGTNVFNVTAGGNGYFAGNVGIGGNLNAVGVIHSDREVNACSNVGTSGPTVVSCSHLRWVGDGNNYMRGNLIVDGSGGTGANLRVAGNVGIGGNPPDPDPAVGGRLYVNGKIRASGPICSDSSASCLGPGGAVTVHTHPPPTMGQLGCTWSGVKCDGLDTTHICGAGRYVAGVAFVGHQPCGHNVGIQVYCCDPW